MKIHLVLLGGKDDTVIRFWLDKYIEKNCLFSYWALLRNEFKRRQTFEYVVKAKGGEVDGISDKEV